MHRFGSLCVALLLFISLVVPVGRSQAQDAGQRCFEATGFCISGRILAFYELNGGDFLFGAPISEQREEVIQGVPREVQWFERTRLELHPEMPQPQDVQVGLLGYEVLAQRGINWEELPKAEEPGALTCEFFPQTGHNVCGEFLAAWLSYGVALDDSPGVTRGESLALFGLPLSGALPETLADGNTYTVQYFERARFEYYPENEFPFRVLFGSLGVELLSVGASEPTAAAGDRIVFASDPGFQEGGAPPNILVINADGSEVAQLTETGAIDIEPVWSPDGERIAFSSNRSGNWDIYVMNMDGSDVRQITDDPGADVNPAWSPDGTKIVFASNRGVETALEVTPAYAEGANLYVMNADGSALGQLTNTPGEDMQPDWSPDGSLVAFSSNRAGPQAIYVVNIDGSGASPVANTPGRDMAPAWSPDGSQIAFMRIDDEDNPNGTPVDGEVYIVRIGENEATRLTSEETGGRDPAWSPDGSQIVFWSARNETLTTNLLALNVDGSNLVYIGNGTYPAWAR